MYMVEGIHTFYHDYCMATRTELLHKRLQIARPDIVRYFEQRGQPLYSADALRSVFSERRDDWRAQQRATGDQFIEYLLKTRLFREVDLTSPSRPPMERFAWGDPSPFEIAIALRRGSYLSHGTAVFHLGLTDQVPNTIYVNQEQSPKPRPAQTSLPAQEAIDTAFARPQRETGSVYEWEGTTFVLLAGMNTENLEVRRIDGLAGEQLPCTGLERTLIDIAVRPSYAGGIFQVLDVYKGARDSLSVRLLVATLRRLDFVYPYGQSIGFLLERCGVPEEKLELIRDDLSFSRDFYVTHAMEDPAYDSTWSVFYPRGL